MDFHQLITWIWFVTGLLLIAVEFIVPGIVIVFFGFAALIIAGLRHWFGLESLPLSLLLWILFSGALMALLRSIILHWISPEKTVVQKVHFDLQTDELTIVNVIKTCYEDNAEGRIEYQGTTWKAMALEGTIPKGQKARLISKDGLVWIVEAVDPLDEFELLDQNASDVFHDFDDFDDLNQDDFDPLEEEITVPRKTRHSKKSLHRE